MAVRHEQKAVEEGTSASEAAALEQERRMLYCLSQVPSLGAVSIQELGEFFGGFSNLFNIEETAPTVSNVIAVTTTRIRGFFRYKSVNISFKLPLLPPINA